MNYQQGMALASRAIGDAYHCSNMAQEAIDSYKEAIQYHITSPDHNLFKEATTLKLISPQNTNMPAPLYIFLITSSIQPSISKKKIFKKQRNTSKKQNTFTHQTRSLISILFSTLHAGNTTKPSVHTIRKTSRTTICMCHTPRPTF